MRMLPFPHSNPGGKLFNHFVRNLSIHFLITFSFILLTGGILVADENTPPKARDILVTATRVEKNIREIPARIEVIAPSALIYSGALTVDELFKRIGGSRSAWQRISGIGNKK